jgi:hypothetical protein
MEIWWGNFSKVTNFMAERILRKWVSVMWIRTELFKLWSSGLWHRVILSMDTNVSEEHAASIFRSEHWRWGQHDPLKCWHLPIRHFLCSVRFCVSGVVPLNGITNSATHSASCPMATASYFSWDNAATARNWPLTCIKCQNAYIIVFRCRDYHHFKAVMSRLEPTQPPSDEYRGGWNMKVTTRLELLQRIRMCGALMPLPYTHLRLRARGNFSIYISNSD